MENWIGNRNQPEQVSLAPKLQLRNTREKALASGGKEAGASTTDVSKPELGNKENFPL